MEPRWATMVRADLVNAALACPVYGDGRETTYIRDATAVRSQHAFQHASDTGG